MLLLVPGTTGSTVLEVFAFYLPGIVDTYPSKTKNETEHAQIWLINLLTYFLGKSRKHTMDKVQASDTAPIGLDCSNASELTKSMENYLALMMHPSNGFVKSTADGMALPQFPCLIVNYKNRPGPLVTPNLVPTRPVFDIQDKTPEPTQRLGSNGHVCESDTMCKLSIC
jgi:hypothetical protein